MDFGENDKTANSILRIQQSAYENDGYQFLVLLSIDPVSKTVSVFLFVLAAQCLRLPFQPDASQRQRHGAACPHSKHRLETSPDKRMVFLV